MNLHEWLPFVTREPEVVVLSEQIFDASSNERRHLAQKYAESRNTSISSSAALPRTSQEVPINTHSRAALHTASINREKPNVAYRRSPARKTDPKPDYGKTITIIIGAEYKYDYSEFALALEYTLL
ncbi:unnamed protein product [Gongylonema pulchrum]|uniref:Uncharacterized protein n=1 Tax=Gongylonema pulchrum TaxID=637853 RepID=A0A183DNC9_9BILA|nr:unnamed protein product [Gongylonema pulchrum]